MASFGSKKGWLWATDSTSQVTCWIRTSSTNWGRGKMDRKEQGSRSFSVMVTRKRAKWLRETLGREGGVGKESPMGVEPHGRSGPCPLTNGSVLSGLHSEILGTLSHLSHLPASSVREGRKKGLYGFSNSFFLISAHLCSLWMELYGQIS